MNARELFGETARYSTFNREERNCVAMLYYALLLGDNVSRFYEALGRPIEGKPDDVEVFVEWSYLRDLWNNHNDSVLRRKLILDHLAVANDAELRVAPIGEFNAYFGATPAVSSTYIQSPATWSISRFAKTITDSEEFLQACRFKWAFRVKPDLVIQPNPDTALCIEAKWDSGEGQYPAVASEIAEFKHRGLSTLTQRHVQRYMMEELLGIHSQFRFLVRKPPKVTEPDVITWKGAFASLDLSGCPPFIRLWVKSLDE